MTPPEQRWLHKMAEDLKIAAIAMREGIHSQTCFHCQQAAEKALKGFLVSKGRNYPRTHRLSDIFACCESLPGDRRELVAVLDFLDTFYIPSRYPDAPAGAAPGGDPPAEIASRALEGARLVCGLVEKAVKPD